MKKTMIAILTMAAPGLTVAQTKWDIDNAHSQVMFNVSHLVISEVTGQFKTFSGNITTSNPDFTDAVIDFQIDVASINTDNQMRDDHL
jgi:polyisoprenoid-binding protein YceI